MRARKALPLALGITTTIIFCPCTWAAQDLYLNVVLNGRDTQSIMHIVQRDERLYAERADLLKIGLAGDNLLTGSKLHATGPVALDRIAGLRYRYLRSSQVLELTARDDILEPLVLNQSPQPEIPPASAGTGLVLNYDAFAQSRRAARLAVWTEARYFNPRGVLRNTGVNSFNRAPHSYVRYDTSWTESDAASLTTRRLGDTISMSLPWTRSVRLGGIQLARNFGLRPDLVTFPMPSLGGSAVVPSSVDVYVNNTRSYSGRVPAGPFVLDRITGLNGAGDINLVTTDALGRRVSTTVPIYIDSRLLAPGLSDYSAEIGFLRRDYGYRSFRYASRPVASGSLRRGISPDLTAEWHAEAAPGLYNAGGGALVQLSRGGVANGSLAASAGTRAGLQFGLGYQYVERRYALDLQTLRALRGYRDLAAQEGYATPAALDRLTFSLPIGLSRSVAASYLRIAYPKMTRQSLAALSLSSTLHRRLSASIGAVRSFGRHSSTGLLLSVNMAWDNGATITASSNRQYGANSQTVSASRPPDYDGGWGWSVQSTQGRWPQNTALVQYDSGYGSVLASAARFRRGNLQALQARGALVLMDGHVQPSRQIQDGFALVSASGRADVPVLNHNRLIGRTDARGYLLVPDLASYEHNEIAIDSRQLAANARIARSDTDVVPQAGSGVLAAFEISRYDAATVIVSNADTGAVPAGTRAHHNESGSDTVVGYDGMVFVEHLSANNTLVIGQSPSICTVRFAYEAPADGSLPTIGPLPCEPS